MDDLNLVGGAKLNHIFNVRQFAFFYVGKLDFLHYSCTFNENYFRLIEHQHPGSFTCILFLFYLSLFASVAPLYIFCLDRGIRINIDKKLNLRAKEEPTSLLWTFFNSFPIGSGLLAPPTEA